MPPKTPKTPAKTATADKADTEGAGSGGKGSGRAFSADDQFKFLISCIRHSSDGKVDFNKVADECGSPTKGAAAKRYERLMKAHGIRHPATTTAGGSNGDGNGKTTPNSKAKTPQKGKANGTKRKIDEVETPEAENADDVVKESPDAKDVPLPSTPTPKKGKDGSRAPKSVKKEEDDGSPLGKDIKEEVVEEA